MLSLQHGVLFGFRSESVHTIFDADFCCFFPRVAFAQQPFRKALDTFSVWIAEIGYSFFIIFFFSVVFSVSLPFGAMVSWICTCPADCISHRHFQWSILSCDFPLYLMHFLHWGQPFDRLNKVKAIIHWALDKSRSDTFNFVRFRFEMMAFVTFHHDVFLWKYLVSWMAAWKAA